MATDSPIGRKSWGVENPNEISLCDPDDPNTELFDWLEPGQSLNPLDPDTDGDGLTDREEVDGIDFHCGESCVDDEKNPIRKTNPLDPDTDGDGRSDSVEFFKPWVVEVTGSTSSASSGEGSDSAAATGPKREEVFSDPTVADADGDGVLDFEEHFWDAHPYKFDTDGDGTGDELEVERDPSMIAIPNHWVTIVYDGMRVISDGSNGGKNNEGENITNYPGFWQFDFGVRRIGGLDIRQPATYESLISETDFIAAADADDFPKCPVITVSTVPFVTAPDLNASRCVTPKTVFFVGAPNEWPRVLQMASGSSVVFGGIGDRAGRDAIGPASTPTSFSVREDGFFALEGSVRNRPPTSLEIEFSTGKESGSDFYFFGGFADGQGFFSGSDLEKGTHLGTGSDSVFEVRLEDIGATVQILAHIIVE